nr:PREDICTED: cilia- and flagella-associated protein 45-like [Paralichthys olivaceus]
MLHQANINIKGAYYLSSDEYKRIVSTIQVLPEENEGASNVVYQTEAEKDAAERRRLQLEWDKLLKMEKDKEISELDKREKENVKAAKEKKCQLEHAKDLRMEDEQEIQELNRQILSVMYFPIQKAQLRDNEQQKEKLLKDEKDLNAMVYAEHRKICKRLDERDEMHRQNAIKARQEIQNQIQQNLEKKKLKDEMKKLEAQKVRHIQYLMSQEDLIDLQKKREKAQHFYNTSLQAYAKTKAAQEQNKVEDMLAEKKIVENTLKELERKSKYEEEQSQIKKEKMLQLAKQWAQQRKDVDELAAKQLLYAQSHQNAKAIEWRRKEKELSEKKAKVEAELREAHSEQIRCIEHACELEVVRQKEEFEACLEKQMKGIKAEQEKEKKQQEKRLLNLEVLKEQVREHELLAEAKRRQEIEYTNLMREEAQQRSMCINKYKEMKLRGIRAAGLPDKYVVDLARKAGISVEKCLECHEGTNKYKPQPAYFPLTVRAANKQLQDALQSTGGGS